MKLKLETFTYMAIKERLACIITTETVMCIMHCRKYHLHNCNGNFDLHNYNKNCHLHICCRNCHLRMCCKNFQLHNCNRNSHLYDCNRKIHQHTSSIVLPQNLHKFNRRCHLHNCHKVSFAQFQQKLPPAELTTESFTYRNGVSLRFFQLQ